MKILVTGHRGSIGQVIQADLRKMGHYVVGYDRLEGDDILERTALEQATQGCDAVVHLAALLGAEGESDQDIMQINVQGTWNVLVAAEKARMKRVVYMSSVDVLGVFKGERAPDYLPLDDDHSCYPTTAYGISKYLSEELCRLWAARTDIPTVCLRPPGVWHPETYEQIQEARVKRPSFEWEPFWEYGAFVDVRDLSTVTLQALFHPVEGFLYGLVAANDITTSGKSSRELVEFLHPDVVWRGDKAYESDPYCALLDTQKIQKLLDWTPAYRWQKFISNG